MQGNYEESSELFTYYMNASLVALNAQKPQFRQILIEIKF